METLQQIQQMQRIGISDGNIQESEPFNVERENGDMFVRLINPGLIEVLRKYLQAESLYERSPKVVSLNIKKIRVKCFK